MSEIEYVAYGSGFALKVEPEERAADVLHYLVTGHLMGGRPLNGAKWRKISDDEYRKLTERRAEELMESMRDCS